MDVYNVVITVQIEAESSCTYVQSLSAVNGSAQCIVW